MESPEEIFKKIDADGSGEIDVFELQQALAGVGLNFSLKIVRALMRLHDGDGNGRINLQEFEKLHMFTMNLVNGFKVFDTDSDGGLDRHESSLALRHAGFTLAPQAFDCLFDSWDPDQSGCLHLGEFLPMCVFLEGVCRLFNATDTKRTGEITLNFNQFVYACARAT